MTDNNAGLKSSIKLWVDWDKLNDENTPKQNHVNSIHKIPEALLKISVKAEKIDFPFFKKENKTEFNNTIEVISTNTNIKPIDEQTLLKISEEAEKTEFPFFQKEKRKPINVKIDNSNIKIKKNIKIRESICDKMCEEYNTFYYNDYFYFYNHEKGCFIKFKENDFNSVAELLASNEQRLKINNNLIREIQGKIKRSRYEREMTFNPDKNLVNFRNGVFDVENEKLYRHSPNYYFNYCIDADYYRNIPLGFTTYNFLNNLSSGKEENLLFLQEISGYLLSNYCLKTGIFMVGEPDCGKSKYIGFISSLIGESMVSHLPLNRFNDEFGLSDMYGMRLNYSGEMDRTSAQSLTEFKSITGGDSVRINFKNRVAFPEKLNIRLFFAGNNLFSANLKEIDDAVLNRVTVFYCGEGIPKERQDDDLDKKLLSECDGFVSWAMEGLVRLVNNKFMFTYSRDGVRYKNMHFGAFIKNSVDKFIDDNIIFCNSEELITIDDIYECYLYYCDEKGYKPHARDARKPSFIELFINKGAKEIRSPTNGENHKRCLCGIKFTDNQF